MARDRGLSTTTLRVLRAAVAAIRPRGHGFDQPIDGEVLDAVVAFLPYLPGPMRLAFPIGLRLLELGPPLVLRRFARFSSLPLEDGRAYLEKVHAAGGAFGALVLGLRALVLTNFYQHPEVLKALEVDWPGRAVALTERRATLLEGLSA